jgi:hypothetical protein
MCIELAWINFFNRFSCIESIPQLEHVYATWSSSVYKKQLFHFSYYRCQWKETKKCVPIQIEKKRIYLLIKISLLYYRIWNAIRFTQVMQHSKLFFFFNIRVYFTIPRIAVSYFQKQIINIVL